MARKPKHYKPGPGDEFVRLADLSPEHVGRIFEARDVRTGEGYLGTLADANHYLLQGAVMIRFTGETLGIFGIPADTILMKPLDFQPPAVAD